MGQKLVGTLGPFPEHILTPTTFLSLFCSCVCGGFKAPFWPKSWPKNAYFRSFGDSQASPWLCRYVTDVVQELLSAHCASARKAATLGIPLL